MKLSVTVKYDSPYPASISILMCGDMPIANFILFRQKNKNYSIILNFPDYLIKNLNENFSIVTCDGVEILNISKVLYEQELLVFYDGKEDKFFKQDFNAIKMNKEDHHE